MFLTVLRRSRVGQQKYDGTLEADYTSQVATIPLTHAVIAAVEIQPKARSHPLTVNSPMILGSAVIIIRMTITGTATTPLITALQ